MTKQELLDELNKLSDPSLPHDEERDHPIADDLLLKFINDPEITAAFEKIEKWYA